jgi:murein DD-endopeptidase MepM/ murein hydrolase activator NlpD
MIHPGRWSYRYNYRYSEGSQSAHHDPTHVYALPYETDESFPVTVIKGQEYHFEMPEDTPVLAAREGVVVAAEKRYSRNGMSDDFYRRVNRVLIRHHDGTLGAYYHLRPGGVVVEPGDRVEVGDLLGYSGKTGHTEIPQLAFCVVKARDGNSQQYFPLRFATSESAGGTTLRSGMTYQAPGDDPYSF